MHRLLGFAAVFSLVASLASASDIELTTGAAASAGRLRAVGRIAVRDFGPWWTRAIECDPRLLGSLGREGDHASIALGVRPTRTLRVEGGLGVHRQGSSLAGAIANADLATARADRRWTPAYHVELGILMPFGETIAMSLNARYAFLDTPRVVAGGGRFATREASIVAGLAFPF